MRRTLKARFLLGAALAALVGFTFATATSRAAPILYGNFSGATVDYLAVTEDANSAGDAPPLFGPPTVSGDSLDFSPVGFSASAAGAFGVDQTDGNLSFMIQGKTNPDGSINAINTILIAEAGDTSLLGFGTDATFTQVQTFIRLDILDTNIGPVNVNFATTITNFSPSGGNYGQGTDGGGGPTFSTNWNGDVLLELGPILVNAGINGAAATKVTLNIDNVLSALSENGTTATIAKKDFDSSAITIKVNNDIPEPTTALLALAGLLALVCRRQV